MRFNVKFLVRILLVSALCTGLPSRAHAQESFDSQEFNLIAGTVNTDSALERKRIRAGIRYRKCLSKVSMIKKPKARIKAEQACLKKMPFKI